MLTDNQRHLALVMAPMVLVISLIVLNELRDDPRTIQASKANAELEFTALPDSQRMYRMVNRRTGVRAYLTLSPDEILTAPVQVVSCDGFLPPWIPSFEKADSRACLTARTNQREQRSFSSFIVNVDNAPAVFNFYKHALEGTRGFSELANGQLPTDVGGDISAIVEYVHETDGRRVTFDYYRSSPSRQAAVVIEFRIN